MDNNQVAKPDQAQDIYVPEVFNLYVYFNPKSLPDKSSLSLNMTRGNIMFDFSQKEADGSLTKISKRIPLEDLAGFAEWVKNLIGKRINEFGATKTYSKIDNCSYDTTWYDKNTGQYVPSGSIFFCTKNINGVERVAIGATDNKGGKVITVVLYNESAPRCFAKTNEFAIIESCDIRLYHFGMILRDAPTTAVIMIYAIGDKIMQGLRRAFPAAFPPNKTAPNKKPWIDFKNRFKPRDNNNPGQYNRPAPIQNTGPVDEGENIFDF